MGTTITVVIAVVFAVLVVGGLAVRIIEQYEQGVLFRFGRVQGDLDRGPTASCGSRSTPATRSDGCT